MDKMKKFRNDSYAEINRYKREIGTLKTVLKLRGTNRFAEPTESKAPC